ncbi:MAG: Flagellar protein FlgJ [Hydrocarboniphaga sp.]|uniref:flagellar assembly peptidoglycan hydrolase FlgJ n=1 Tax=Hydrocarboniphaga sp. TaxID=2033016 RepID=UPI0026065D7F|nr:flagellar assembly peptidoglycan hydrolase FlgJ [Hydrocarboniphaga sp.]MDB5967588.1 Flagellar protein FlgJ [Hydrocarboniphaga sp.]
MISSAPQLNALDLGQLQSLRASVRADDSTALKKSAQQFEALFTQMMLKSMRDALPGDSTMGEQGDFYQGMYDQQLSLSLSSGKGMGLADLLVQQLTQARSAVATAEPVGSDFSPTPPPVQSVGLKPDPQAASTADWPPVDAQDFIDKIRPHAEKAAQALGVPARAIMAQAALETGWGKHMSRDSDGSASYNLFGIKANKSWSGDSVQTSTQEYRRGSFGSEQAAFRSYDSLADSFDDYVSFLKDNPRYLQALRADTVQGFAQGLQKAGYATDPGYAGKIVDVANGSNMSAALSSARARYSV